MFFQDGLHNGVSRALQEQKLVVCLVIGNDEASQAWETLCMQDEDIRNALESRAVTFKLVEGSLEAGFLSVFCLIESSPQLIVIKDGALHAQLKQDLSHPLKERLLDAIMHHSPSIPQIEQSDSAGTGVSGPHGGVSDPLPETPQDETTQSQDMTPRSRDRTPSLESLFGERRKRLEADKAAKEKAERDRLKAIAKAQREKAEAARPGASQSSQASWAWTQMERKRAQQSERERILKAIESDKIERRERDRRQKEAAEARKAGTYDIVKPTEEPKNQSKCAVRVRIFDGSTLSRQFSPSETIHDVRSWIDEQGEHGIPYNLKQVLTPLPNRQITVSEERQTLQSLGLTPSAILVASPIRDFTTAARPSGHVAKVVSACFGWFWYLISIVMHTLSIGRRPNGPTNEQDHETGGDMDRKGEAKSATARNVRTLHESRVPKDDQQFYNGNQLNFEARDDEDNDQR